MQVVLIDNHQRRPLTARGDVLTGLPELAVGGLAEADARTLLDTVLAGPVDARVREQIIAETEGNPLALLDLSRGATPAELAGGFGLPGALPLTEPIEDSSRRQIDPLPAQTQRLLLLAARIDRDPVLVWRTAGRLGVGARAAARAARAGVAEFGGRARFRHPLVRSAAYQSAPALERRQTHAALAEATDPAADPDRRAWHRALAATGPDEDVAAELEHSAGRAQAPGGLAAAAAFWERAAALTADPARRAGRTRPRPGLTCTPARSARHWNCWPRRRPGRWMSCKAPGWTGCAGRSRSPPGWAATLPRCC